ncbi:PREDICTED: serine/threonine-protein kinase LMTK1 isoform X6 [Hipposideros armiger]|uniref:non-specific serine/threonine protein kinase n=1 Tax=Hipposideros armiger TaxID=186990 RepID=A0A8B7SZI0_HIPAR|nr:PREDICTED: serine/threonine-protein kinase LMTK1 isoform X6 [Hipposideros armiger]
MEINPFPALSGAHRRTGSPAGPPRGLGPVEAGGPGGWYPAQRRSPAVWVDSRGVRPTPVSLWTFLAQVTGAGRPVFAPGEQTAPRSASSPGRLPWPWWRCPSQVSSLSSPSCWPACAARRVASGSRIALWTWWDGLPQTDRRGSCQVGPSPVPGSEGPGSGLWPAGVKVQGRPAGRWLWSLRMLKGKSTPTSRPRAPQRPLRRTGLTCTSCRSPRSPCPWPSSRGVQGPSTRLTAHAADAPAPAHCPPVAELESLQLLKATDLGRHSLLYLEEIGHGWFGKVFLGEVSSGILSTQVVVKELKASASVHEQVQFLEEAQPYRALQHGNLLQCLAQCAEVTPYLLVMEFCPMGDLKGYLRSCRVAESMAPDPLTLQRMACEVACGVLHLHRNNNYVHSDLALRNCLLTADLTVKIGDYGLSHGKYREDYFVTADQLWVPLRWIAPELVDEVHCNLLVVDQTKASNVWYEVMQFCWLQPEQRPTAEEVHLLLSYLCAKGTTEAEEEFEQRWRSLRPGGGGMGPGLGAAGLALGGAGELAAASSFPLLEQFAGDGFHADGDDVLTVTETSRGLNFEYKWEAGRGAEAFSPPGGAPSPGHTAHLQALCAPDGAPPGVVPVLSAHSPSVGSEYFIRLEEPAPVVGHDPDCGCAPSPLAAALASQGSDHNDNSDCSAATSLAMEPLLGRAPSTRSPWGHCDYYPYRSVTQGPPCLSRSASPAALMLAEPGVEDTDWGVATFCPPFFEDPLGTSPSGTSGAQGSLGEEEEPGEAEARRAAHHRNWSSNMSANNNSGSRAPESWAPGYAGGYAAGCPDRKPTLRAVPELGHPLALEDPREPLLGPEGASFGQKPGLGLPHLCAAESLAPATSLVTSPWTEAAVSGFDSPQIEPRLAEEPEGSAGPQLSLPSIPSPSREGAPLPTEEASAPAALPALPTPASSWATATEPARALDSGSSSLELEAPGSEDEDTTEATSGVFTDLSSDGPQAEKLDMMPAFRSLQKQVGTPDSLDSLDIPSSASDGGCEVFSPSAAGTSGGQPRALDSGYDTENYESPEFVLKETHEPCEPEVFGELASEGESPGAESRLSASLSSLSEKNPYRDSAYFSDLDTEPETPVDPEKRGRGVPAPGPEPDLESGQSSGLQPAQSSSESGVSAEAQSQGPREVPPLQLCEVSSLEPRACSAGPRPEPLWTQGPAQVPPVPSPAHSKIFLLTPVPPNSESHRPELQEAQGLLSAPQERTGGPGAPRAPLCLALPGLPAAPEGRQEEDEEDSEDSDESDEELRCYSVQEPSEESEEEAPPVPVVVAESQSARNLRSLLKMPSLLSEAFCEDLERKKKAVSFFDDVTVYLFDQESPTRELGEPFPGAKESPPTRQAGSPSSPSAPCRPRRAAGPPDGFAEEQGRGFEWDDGFPLTPSGEPALAAPTAPSKAAAPGLLSRFSVSPAPASRFSITHVSDSDAGSVGGRPSASPATLGLSLAQCVLNGHLNKRDSLQEASPAGGAGGSCKEA